MDAQQIAVLRAALEERRAEIGNDLTSMAGELRSIGQEQGDENGGLGNHIAEDGSSMTESERLTTMTEDMRAMVEQIDAALQRMDEGTFGICQRCGKPIGVERIEAFPYVANCISCQAGIEHERSLRTGF